MVAKLCHFTTVVRFGLESNSYANENPRANDVQQDCGRLSTYSKSSAILVVLLVTIIEDSGLIAWLALLHTSMIYMGISIAALVLLVVLLIEHSIMQRAENPDFTGKVFLEIIGFTTLEVINWSVWLALLSNTSSLFSMTSLLASAYFFVGFYIEHQITENVITRQPFLHLRNARGVIATAVSPP